MHTSNPLIRFAKQTALGIALLSAASLTSLSLQAATISYDGLSGSATGVTVQGVTFGGGEFTSGDSLGSVVISGSALRTQNSFLTFTFSQPVDEYSFGLAFLSDNAQTTFLVESFGPTLDLLDSSYIAGASGPGSNLIQTYFYYSGAPASQVRVTLQNDLVQGGAFFIDDLGYNLAIADVPEPSTFMLSGGALAFALFARGRVSRRRNTKQ